MAASAIASFNSTIAGVASAKNAVLFDANTALAKLNTTGYNADGTLFTSAYVSGGAFSLNGVHPSARGYGIVASEIIKLMNAKFGMSVPLVDVNTLPGIPSPLAKAAGNVLPSIPYSSFKSFDWLFRQSNE